MKSRRIFAIFNNKYLYSYNALFRYDNKTKSWRYVRKSKKIDNFE